MFNEGFYPSPKKVRELLLSGLDLRGARVLEPSAGKGDLVQEIVKKSDSAKVEVIELENDLCAFLQGKGYPLVGNDFLHFDTHTEYDAIIMNPPFAEGDKHLIKAIKLAENQVTRNCVIRCVLNAETLNNPFSSTRKELGHLLQKYAANIEFHADLFKQADRTTNVEVAIIKVSVDCVRTRVSTIYGNLLKTIDFSQKSEIQTSLSTIVQSNEIEKRASDIAALVKQYEYHIELIKERYAADKAVSYLESMLPNDFRSAMSQLPDINDDIERVRGQYWMAILNTKDFSDKLTSHGRNQLNKQLQGTQRYEINLVNIKMLLIALSQNSSSILLDSCINIFEKITLRHQREFSSNIHYYNGWKSNDAFKVNKKFILPFGGFSGMFSHSDMGEHYASDEITYDNVTWEVKEFISDLNRVFELLVPGASFEFKTLGIGDFENEVFRFKMFGKGTIHFWVKDLSVLDHFNVLCGQHFNWLPHDEVILKDKEASKYMQSEFKEYMKTLKIA